ncbi:MAG: hypothetical protein R6U37_06270 [Dehalococcoidia bacterium]
MEKLIYLLWAPGERDFDEIGQTLLKDCAPGMLELNPISLSMNLNDSDADIPSPVPPPEGEQLLAAEVSIWLNCYENRSAFEEVLKKADCRMAGYLVTESLYTDYGDNEYSGPRDWPDGQRSPGILTVAVFEKPEHIPYEEWINRWHGVQSVVSGQVQPRARYVRNEVVRALTPDAPPYKGIVEEAWPSAKHVTDPMLFFCAEGSEEKLTDNINRMMESVNAFLDMDRFRSYTMSEYLLKT